MHFRNFPILAVLLAVGVQALLPRSILVARQTGFGPCTATCEPFNSTVGLCLTTACLCTDAVATSLQTCVDCVTAANPSVDTSSKAQTLIDAFFKACMGFGLHTVTVKAGGPSTIVTPPTVTAPVPSVTPPSPTPTTPVQTIVRPSASVTPTSPATTPASGSTSIPKPVGASGRNMFAEVGVVNVVGAMILGVMLVF